MPNREESAVIQIAICDDEEQEVLQQRAIVEHSLRQCGTGGTVAVYTQSRNLLADILEEGVFFDLLLLDIEMPGISGMELTEKIRSVLPRVKIIFVTSHTE